MQRAETGDRARCAQVVHRSRAQIRLRVIAHARAQTSARTSAQTMYVPEPNLNTPPESGAGRKLRRQAQHAAKALNVGAWQGLGEDVGDLHVRWDEHWRDGASLDDVAQPVVAQVEVLHATMVLWVVSDRDRGLLRFGSGAYMVCALVRALVRAHACAQVPVHDDAQP